MTLTSHRASQEDFYQCRANAEAKNKFIKSIFRLVDLIVRA